MKSSLSNVRLGEVAVESLVRAESNNLDLPVYGVDNSVGLTKQSKYQSADLSRYKVIQPGMFAYNPMRLNIGSIGYLRSDGQPGLVSPDYVVFKCSQGVLPEFLHYISKGESWKNWCAAAGSGSVRSRIYFRDLANFSLNLPSIAYQKSAIRLLGNIEKLIESIEIENQHHDALAQMLFKSWFVDFDPVRAKLEGRLPDGMDEVTATQFPESLEKSDLGLIPLGWRVSTLGEETSHLSRGISPKYLDDGGVVVINQKCIRDFCLDLSKARRHDPEQRKIDGRKLLKGDVLVNSTGVGTLGRIAQVLSLEYPAIVDSHVTFIRSGPTLTWNYLGLSMMRRQPEIEAMGEGSTGQTELNRGKLSTLKILVPPMDVLKRFDKISLPLRERFSANQMKVEELTTLRETLLHRLVSGQLRINEFAE